MWTKNPGAWQHGQLHWTVYQERVDPGHWDYCEYFGPCDHGEGDCDSDSECTSGHACKWDVGAEYGWDSAVDVCEADLPNGHYDYCRVQGPCEAGEGDCDSDAECLPWLVCGNDNGPQYGFASWVDVCR